MLCPGWIGCARIPARGRSLRSLHLKIWLQLQRFADVGHASKALGRLLLGLLAVFMPAMMWTERFLTWDKFLQGGQDLELGIVALVAFLCLILLLAQRSQQALHRRLAVYSLLAIAGQGLKLASRCSSPTCTLIIAPGADDDCCLMNCTVGFCPAPLRI